MQCNLKGFKSGVARSKNNDFVFKCIRKTI